MNVIIEGTPLCPTKGMSHEAAYDDGATVPGGPEGLGTQGARVFGEAGRDQGTPPGAVGPPPGMGSGDTSSDGEPLPEGQLYGKVRSPGGVIKGSPILNS